MSNKIGFFNLEKNTGKTTSVAYLAEGLASLNKSVLAVDLDSNKNLEKYLGLKLIKGAGTTRVTGSQSGWNFLSFNDFNINNVEIFETYDYVLFDFPSSFNNISDQVIELVDSVIIPVECEFYGMESLALSLEKVMSFKNLEIEGILMVKYDPINTILPSFKKSLINNFGNMVFNTVISRSYYLGKKQFSLENLNQTQSHFGFADYLKLAHELTEKIEINE